MTLCGRIFHGVNPHDILYSGRYDQALYPAQYDGSGPLPFSPVQNGNPDIGDHPIDALDIKLTPCVSCTEKPTEEDFDAEREEAAKLMADIQVDDISGPAKKEILNQIHVNVSEEPIACAECHNRENPFLPLHEAGYPDHRIALVASDQITKMINEYEEFYTPTFLEPGVQNNHANE